MKLSDIGKVLFIDDDYSTIKDAVESFLDVGIQVQYWKGSGKLPSSIFNVRIVVIDLDLTRLNMRPPGDDFFIPAVDAIKMISGPFIVIIVAREFREGDSDRLRKMYFERTKSPLFGFIADSGLTKEQLEDPNILEGLIVSVLENNEVLRLILSWEGIFDRSKDAALRDILTHDMVAPAKALINILCSNFGETKATARELIDIMTSLVSRRTSEAINFDDLVKIICEIKQNIHLNIDNYPGLEDLCLYSKLSFYKPSVEEDVMTGDIYEITGKFNWGIVLTPKCDFTHEGTDKVLICYGFPLKREYFYEKEFPPNKNDPEFTKLSSEKSPDEISKITEKRFLDKTLPQTSHILWHFCPEDGIYGLCLDFKCVASIEKNEVKKWKKLSRLGSPYIEALLQKYGNIISRIGTLEIQHKSSKLKKDMIKITEKTETN